MVVFRAGRSRGLSCSVFTVQRSMPQAALGMTPRDGTGRQNRRHRHNPRKDDPLGAQPRSIGLRVSYQVSRRR